MLFLGGTKRNEKQTLSTWVQKGNPEAEVIVFADLSLRFAPDNWGLFSTVNLCQFESNQLWSVQIVLSSGDGRPDLRDIFLRMLSCKIRDYGGSWIIANCLIDAGRLGSFAGLLF